VISYLRYARDGSFVVVVLNFTPVPRQACRIGVPENGTYRELLNSDSSYFGGSNVGNAGALDAVAGPWMDQPFSLTLTLPPLAALVLARREHREAGRP
jgi:1,4-alpha-glucan branching enzyme